VAEAVASIGAGAPARALRCARDLLHNARDGTRLLCAGPAGFSVRSLCAHDWDFLVGLADDDVGQAHSAGRPPFTPERLEIRRRTDQWTGAVLDGYRS
jgi:hypothetical protein